MLDLDHLNPPQREAVTAPDGPVLVVAGAGSGKTRVLTTRVAWLLDQGRCGPGGIVAFTFTNRAARQMVERVHRLVDGAPAPRWIGTFHATGARILRRDGRALGIDPDFTIFDTDDSTRLLKRVMAEVGLDPRQTAPALARSVVSRWKNDDVAPARAAREARDHREEKLAAAYAAYQRELRRNNALDFDDLILETVHLLENHAEVRLAYADRFRYVLVDEFQDTNPLQLLMVKALCSVWGNVFAVGDDDQSIYSWRGARVENMLEFESYFPGTTVIRLEQNYRSTGCILDAANAVIAHNRRRKGKNLWTAGERGEPLRCELLGDEEDEAARVVEIVAEEQRRGLRRGDVTVLYRTNAQSRVLEDALRRADVPYQVVGATAFYERREVRDVLAYLKFIHNPRDTVAALRIINVPRRRLGDTTVRHLVELAAREGLTLGEAAARPGLLEERVGPAACGHLRRFFDQAARWRALAAELPVPELLERVLADVGYGAWLEQDDPLTAAGRQENVQELVNAAHAFHEATDGGGLGRFLEQTALVADADTIADDEGVVRLMTIHAAKGLEFPVVVLAGVEENLLPHVSNLDDAAALEEERRLFYVALTRARLRVHLLHVRSRRRFGQRELALPSRFLAEIPEHLLEQRGEAAAAAPAMPPLFAPRRAASRPTRPSAPTAAVSWDDDVRQVEIAYRPGQRVRHATYGDGVVARVEGHGENLKLAVDFPGRGRKHFLARFARLSPLEE